MIRKKYNMILYKIRRMNYLLSICPKYIIKLDNLIFPIGQCQNLDEKAGRMYMDDIENVFG